MHAETGAGVGAGAVLVTGVALQPTMIATATVVNITPMRGKGLRLLPPAASTRSVCIISTSQCTHWPAYTPSRSIIMRC